MNKIKLLLLIFAITFTGCARLTTEQAAPNLNELNTGKQQSIVFAILDHRPYVLNEEFKSSYIGTLRDGFGIPHHNFLTDDQPLSDYLSETLVFGFSNAGKQAVSISTTPDNSVDDIKTALIKNKVTSFLIEISEWYWHYSAWHSYSDYKARITIYSSNGDLIFSKNYVGDGSMLTGPHWPLLISKNQLERMFSDTGVIDAINK